MEPEKKDDNGESRKRVIPKRVAADKNKVVVKTEVDSDDDGEVDNNMEENSESGSCSEEVSHSDEEDYVPVAKKKKRLPVSKRKSRGCTFKKPTPPATALNLPPLTLKIIPMPVGKRQSLSLKEKIDIIERIKNGEGQNKVATSLKLNRSTIQNIWSNREKFTKEAEQGHWDKRKCRQPNNAHLDGLVFSWVEHMKAQGTPVNGTQIREHAKILARGLGDEEFSASHGWLSHFKMRNKVILPKARTHSRMLQEIRAKEALRDMGETTEHDNRFDDAGDWDAGDDFVADNYDEGNKSSPVIPNAKKPTSSLPKTNANPSKIKTAFASKKASNEWLSRTWSNLCEGYTAENIYFADEFGLFHRTIPEQFKDVQGKSCSNGEFPTERLSILFGINALATERLKLVVVGGIPTPSSFGTGWSSEQQDKLPTEYRFHPKAFITPDIISSWLNKWNAQLKTTAGGGGKRKVLLVMKNSKAHQMVQNLCSGLECVKIVLPTVAGSAVLRFLETEVAAEMRLLYRKLMLNKLIRKNNMEEEQDERITYFDACGMLHTAWLSLESTTIADLFKKSGLVKGEVIEKKKNKGDDRNQIKNLVQETRAAGIRFPKELSFQSFIDLDEKLLAVDISAGMVDSRNVPPHTDGPPCTTTPPTHDLLNNLDHLRNWLVSNQSGDLSSLHHAISTLESFCTKNLMFAHNKSSAYLPSLPPLNRIVPPNQLQQTRVIQQSQSQNHQVSTSGATSSTFFTTVDPKSISITLPAMASVPQCTVTSAPNNSYGITFQNTFATSSQPVSQQNHPQQINYVLSNGHMSNVSVQGITVAANLLQNQQQQQHNLQNQYFSH